MATAAARPFPGLTRLLQSTTLTSTSSTTTLTRSIVSSHQQQTSSFSTTAPLCKRKRHKTRDNNRLRGVSSINRTGPREPLSVSNFPLPRPRVVENPEKPVDPTHPLWEFFYKPGQMVPEPVDDAKHGRGWVVEELRKKSWEDLHRLWYKCVKEQNRIGTAAWGRKRHDIGFGEYESNGRKAEVKKTMRGIKHVLTERYYAWEDAVELAKEDPEINLAGKGGSVYTPQEYLEDEVFEDEPVEQKVAEPAAFPSEAAEQRTIDPVAIPAAATPGKGPEQSAPKA